MRSKICSRAILALLLSIGLAGCQRQPATFAAANDAETAAVRAQADAWFQAISAKDLEKTLSFYASDAHYLSAGRAAASTPDERRSIWIEDYGTPGFASEERTTKIGVARSGDLAYQLGTYTLTTLDKQGIPAHSTGKFVVVWKKQPDGKWKAIADIDNADQ